MANLQVSSEYVPATSSEQLPPINDGVPLLSNLKQVAPMRGCTGAFFATGGIIPFEFDIAPNERGMLNEAYIRLRLQIQGSIPDTYDAGNYKTWTWGAPVKSFCNVPNYTPDFPPVAGANPFVSIPGHDIALSENCVSNMFSGITFKCGGIVLSDIQQFQPQIDMMIRRLTESYTSQKANKYADLVGMTLRERIDYISANAAMPNGSIYTGLGVPGVSANAFAISGAVGGAIGAPILQGTDGICAYPSTSPFGCVKYTNATTAAAVGATFTNVELLWRPRSCGAFNNDQYLVAGKYRLELLPFTNWAVNALESIINIPPANIFSGVKPAVPTAANQFALEVMDLQFFIPICGSPAYIDNTTFYLSLEEYQMQAEKVTSGNTNAITFTIPWSTQTTCMAIQTQSIGYQTLVPPSKFMNICNNANYLFSILDVNSNDLQSLQLQYSKTYPQTNYTSSMSYISATQNNYQRYYDTFSNSRALFDYGQQEPYADATNAMVCFTPFQPNSAVLTAPASTNSRVVPVYGLSQCDYLSRGALYCISVAKPQDNHTTQAQVYIAFNATKSGGSGAFDGYPGLAVSGNPQLLFMSSFKKTAQITVSNGCVIAVNVVEG